jgi:hypothetical protein
MSLQDQSDDLELLLRRIIREEAGVTLVTPAAKWRGGTLVLRPGTPGLQEKSWPIESFFHKVVMLRNRLRTLEQQVNASELPDDVKVKLQAYVAAVTARSPASTCCSPTRPISSKAAAGGTDGFRPTVIQRLLFGASDHTSGKNSSHAASAEGRVSSFFIYPLAFPAVIVGPNRTSGCRGSLPRPQMPGRIGRRAAGQACLR